MALRRSLPNFPMDSKRASAEKRTSRDDDKRLTAAGNAELAGVGIFFLQEKAGKFYVASLVKGGSAERSGVIREGDVIVKVNGEDLTNKPLSALRGWILGPQGSYVTLAFQRSTGTELYYYDVELVRGSPEYFESIKKDQGFKEEIEKLRAQLRQSDAVIHSLRSEYERIRARSQVSDVR